MILILLEITSRPSVKNLFWEAKYFEHFQYIYNHTRDCKNRVDKLLKKDDLADPMPKDVIIKIGIVGDFTMDNVNLISKKPGSIYSLLTFNLLNKNKADFIIVLFKIFVYREK